MSDMQKFDDNIIENLLMFSFKDDEQIYTNGVELVPLFRVVQILEHFKVQELVDRATPMKPIQQTFKQAFKPHKFVNLNFCPVCRERVEVGNCCSNNDCRQALLWKD